MEAVSIFNHQYMEVGSGSSGIYPPRNESEHTGASSAGLEGFWKRWRGSENEILDIFIESYKKKFNLDWDIYELMSAREQLAEIKSKMGLNILEMAAILQVSRPTVYKWLESDDVNINKEHQKRLNTIYDIYKIWNKNHLGRLSIYLHQPMGINKASLFELLKSDKLDQAKIQCFLKHIANLMLRKCKSEQKHDDLLRKHGFDPVSKEEMEDRLKDIDFLD